MRYSFIQELTELAAKNRDLILLTGDLGFTVFEDFAKKYPRQFFNVGVAESNMIGIATGLALSGKTVFAYSIASFASFRPYEFIRNDVCLHKASVVVVGSGAGLSYGEAGPTHFATQDISLMRSLPNMTILCPADPPEARWATREAAKLKSPVYLRLGKKGEPNLHHLSPKLKIGKGHFIKNGPDFVIIGTGNIVFNAYETAKILEKSGVSGSVISMHTVKPIDKKLVVELATTHDHIITIEENTVLGGLGSAVAEIISQMPNKKAKLLIIGLPDTFPHKLGSHNYLREVYGLTPNKLSGRIKKFLSET
ncbi:hypothetical protein A2Z23_03290 [Candidatus Curtissbacteria bacterium RBG_16_39_7]|uniref:Transketolase-like pyrimidine-binding domain-containing protein n=1 Tax=Candidatus Curtissbacteria bacterium RBG_16_39_7 TaxID=1797707 RepID=A0A1F5G4R8_9BACT|nr:MAG: hypothetical protein A2Z23_03290 [Candidatus Curtissbacteria bacterium RBG_16_39_7]